MARLPDEQLEAALRALKAAIKCHKQPRVHAVSHAVLPADFASPFVGFEWSHKVPKVARSELGLTPTTLIEHLPIRASARWKLKELKVLALEDLSAISEFELRTCEDIGETTILRMREWLQSIGLDFGTQPDPRRAMHEVSHAVRALPPSQRAVALDSLPLDAPLARLGLRPTTLRRALRHGWLTVADLHLCTPRDLAVKFGPSEGRELISALALTGRRLRCEPSQLELWRHRLIGLEGLTHPSSDDTPIDDLRPWLGAVVKALSHAGIETLGELKARAAMGTLGKLTGVGPKAHDAVLAYLGLGAPGTSAGAESPRSALSPANSVFNLAR